MSIETHRFGCEARTKNRTTKMCSTLHRDSKIRDKKKAARKQMKVDQPVIAFQLTVFSSATS